MKKNFSTLLRNEEAYGERRGLFSPRNAFSLSSLPRGPPGTPLKRRRRVEEREEGKVKVKNV
jgi:hypothetical protein